MGEARRRRLAKEHAYANGLPTPRPDSCPSCSSKRLRDVDPTSMDATDRAIFEHHFDAPLQLCLDCGAVWEPFPAEGYVEDPVAAEPCDNCAFRPGSPEQRDPERWRELVTHLKPGADPMGDHRFYCHKHMPIDLTVPGHADPARRGGDHLPQSAGF